MRRQDFPAAVVRAMRASHRLPALAAAPAGVAGLRYLPAAQNPVPDTFIGPNDPGWGRRLRRRGAGGIPSCLQLQSQFQLQFTKIQDRPQKYAHDSDLRLLIRGSRFGGLSRA